MSLTKQIVKKQQTLLVDLSADAKLFLETQKKLNEYDIQEEILNDLVKRYKDHSNYEAVETKAKLLNLFYSTGIQAINKVVERIMSIANIDAILNRPSYSKELVDTIAELNLADGSKRNNYSFATKYCALHQPKKYPIYDSIVASIFTTLMEKGALPPYKLKTERKAKSTGLVMTKGEFFEKLRDYDFFVTVYDHFMEDYGLKREFSYRQVDWYLWGSYKEGGSPTEIEKLTQLDPKKYSVYTPKQIKKTITIR